MEVNDVTRTLQPIAARQTAEMIAEQIRQRITDGTFAPGQQLNEAHLAASLKISRGPVREAIARLVSEGLLVSEHNRGASVVVLTPDAIQDIYKARALIETAAVRALVANRDAVLLDRMASLTDEMAQVAPRRDWPRLIELDVAFHTAIVEASSSPRLRRMFRTLIAETRMCMVALKPVYSDMDRLPSEHRALLDVIASGGEFDAVAGIASHLASAVDDLMPSEAGPK